MDEETPSRDQETRAPLPPDRAFVVQLRAERDPNGELFVGRVEHLASGAAEHFGSAAELLAFMTKTMAPHASVPVAASVSAPTGEPVEDLSARRTR